MWRRLLIILAVGAIAALLAERFGPGGRQRCGSDELRAFRQQLEPKLAADPRFARVELMGLTQPSLRVEGSVPNDTARADLAVLCTAPPGANFVVTMRVEVANAPATRPAE